MLNCMLDLIGLQPNRVISALPGQLHWRAEPKTKPFVLLIQLPWATVEEDVKHQ